MEPDIELLQRVTSVLERLGIFYFVTGSIASISYGEPRSTRDIDIVVILDDSHVGPLCKAFPAPEYYLSEDGLRDAVHANFQINIIHNPSGFKVDLIVLGNSDFDRSMAARVRRLKLVSGIEATVISPEDIILNKLLFYRLGESDKHLRDITGILLTNVVDYAYLESWVDKLNVRNIWQAVQKRAAEAP